MKYTIIIAVFNRLNEVRELLASAELLDFDKSLFEILFVDDGSEDGLITFINDYSLSSSLNIRIIQQQNQGPGAARNNGMANAKSEYFIFNDSDILYPSDYLQKIDQALAKYEYDAFGGPDDCHPSFSPLLKAINYSMTSFIGTGGTRGSKKSVTKFYPRSFNMGIRKNVYEKIGGMNMLRHGQDMDFSARIYAEGFKVGLIENAVVFHKRRTSLKRFYKQIFNWGVARINLGRLHPGMSKPIHFLPAVIVGLSIAVLILSLYFKWGNVLLEAGVISVIIILMLVFIQSLFKYKSLLVSCLSMITILIQVYAYGLGTISGLIQSMTSKNSTAKGFTKDYYK